MASEADKLLAGLRSSPKTVPCSFLYDSRGSALYDQVSLQTAGARHLFRSV